MCLHLGNLILIRPLQLIEVLYTLIGRFEIFLSLQDVLLRASDFFLTSFKLLLELLKLLHTRVIRLLLEKGLPHDSIEFVLETVAVLSGFKKSLFDIRVFGCGRLKCNLLHRKSICLVLRLFDFIEELSFIAFSLVKDVRFDLEAGLDVFKASAGLHELEFCLTALSVKLFHVKRAASHALRALNIANQGQTPIFGLVKRPLEVAEDFGTF